MRRDASSLHLEIPTRQRRARLHRQPLAQSVGVVLAALRRHADNDVGHRVAAQIRKQHDDVGAGTAGVDVVALVADKLGARLAGASVAIAGRRVRRWLGYTSPRRLRHGHDYDC